MDSGSTWLKHFLSNLYGQLKWSEKTKIRHVQITWFSCVEPLSMTELCSAKDGWMDGWMDRYYVDNRGSLSQKFWEPLYKKLQQAYKIALYYMLYKKTVQGCCQAFQILTKKDQSNSYHICSIMSFYFLFVSWHYLPAWIKDSRDCWGEQISLWRMHRHLSSFIALFSFYFSCLSAYDETHLLATNVLFKRCWSSQLAFTPGWLTTQVLC